MAGEVREVLKQLENQWGVSQAVGLDLLQRLVNGEKSWLRVL